MPRWFRQSRSCSSVCRATLKSLPDYTSLSGCLGTAPTHLVLPAVPVSRRWKTLAGSGSAYSGAALSPSSSCNTRHFLKHQRDGQGNACLWLCLVMLQFVVVVFLQRKLLYSVRKPIGAISEIQNVWRNFVKAFTFLSYHSFHIFMFYTWLSCYFIDSESLIIVDVFVWSFQHYFI